MAITNGAADQFISPGLHAGKPNASGWYWLALAPAALLILATIVFYLLNIGVTYESQALLTTLNTLFCSSVSLLIVFLAARSYMATGSRAILMLGCGALAFAITYLLAGILLFDLNAAVAVHNSGVFFAGACFALSTCLAFTRKPGEIMPVKAPLYLILAYAGTIVILGLFTAATLASLIPAFYDPVQGFTQLRQAVLDLTVVEFILASVFLVILYNRSRTSFLLWYSLGLLLIGLGIGTLIIEGSPATPLSWVGRGGQYLGGLYLFIAIWSLTKIGGDLRIPLEKALQETEEKYRTIVDTAGEGIWVLDNNAITVSVNQRMADMLGYAPDELVGRNANDFVYREGSETGKQISVNAIKNIKETFELKYCKKDGSPLWAIVSSKQLFDNTGNHIGAFAMFTDITDRKRAEERLAYQANLLANISDVIYSTDDQLRITSWNQAAEKVYGWKKEEVLGKNVLEVTGSTFDPELRARLNLELQKTGLVTSEIDHTSRSGEHIIFESNTMILRDVEGTVVGFVAVNRDITERKQAEKKLWEAKQQAELYLDLMGHDINNMHQIALGYLEIARGNQADGCGNEFLVTPIDVLQRSAQLIQNVRKLQKLHEGVFQTQEVNVAKVLSDVQLEYDATTQKAVTLNLNGYDCCYVKANELLHDVFANLISNAIKHTGDDADIVIDMDVIKHDGRRCCRVMIEDNGQGISDDLKGKVFNRMLRGTTDAKGIGLGLYLVKSLVESYHGTVRVEDRILSDHKKGARFVVLLPAIGE